MTDGASITTPPENARRRRRDWFRILQDLVRAGVSYNEVARKCDRQPATVRCWADGADPKDTDARIVLALYAKFCPLKYVEHMKAYEVRAEILAIESPGEQRMLPWVGS